MGISTSKSHGLGNRLIGARGNRGDDGSQSLGRSKTVGQANKQSETFRNAVGSRSKEWKDLESGRHTRETRHKKVRNSTSLDCKKSRTFAAIEDYTCN